MYEAVYLEGLLLFSCPSSVAPRLRRFGSGNESVLGTRCQVISKPHARKGERESAMPYKCFGKRQMQGDSESRKKSCCLLWGDGGPMGVGTCESEVR